MVLAFGGAIEKTVAMRGNSDPQLAMLTTLSTEDLIPENHPLRKIRAVVDAVLAELDPIFESMYATGGRRSVPPEALLKATVLMAMYSIRSERAFCERLNYDLLFKWFLDTRIDEPAFDATTFSKNRKRLLEAEVADDFFEAVVRIAKLRKYVSSEHFSVDGTLLKAWASHKCFKPKDGPRSSRTLRPDGTLKPAMTATPLSGRELNPLVQNSDPSNFLVITAIRDRHDDCHADDYSPPDLELTHLSNQRRIIEADESATSVLVIFFVRSDIPDEDMLPNSIVRQGFNLVENDPSAKLRLDTGSTFETKLISPHTSPIHNVAVL